jgi:hypothetical protein
MRKIYYQAGFAGVEVLLIAVLAVVVGVGAYYELHGKANKPQTGYLDIKSVGIKLPLSDVNKWSYTLEATKTYINYTGEGAVANITQSTTPPMPSDNNGIDRLSKHIGSEYIVLGKMGCPCSSETEALFSQVATGFKAALPD